MIRRAPTAKADGSTVYFLDDTGFVRRGELLRVVENFAAIHSGTTLLRRPTAVCFANEADAMRARAERLTADIEARQNALASTLAKLAEMAGTEGTDELIEGCNGMCGSCCQS